MEGIIIYRRTYAIENNTTGDRIRSLRKIHNLTQTELGEIIGVAKATVSRYEDGSIHSIPPEILKAIAVTLGTTPEYLLDWDGNAALDPPTKEDIDFKKIGNAQTKLPIEKQTELLKLVHYMYPEIFDK